MLKEEKLPSKGWFQSIQGHRARHLYTKHVRQSSSNSSKRSFLVASHWKDLELRVCGIEPRQVEDEAVKGHKRHHHRSKRSGKRRQLDDEMDETEFADDLSIEQQP